MYTDINYKTKRALKEAVKAGLAVTYYQPGPFAATEPEDGTTIYLEGPHSPAAHTWYAQATVKGGLIVKVT